MSVRKVSIGGIEVEDECLHCIVSEIVKARKADTGLFDRVQTIGSLLEVVAEIIVVDTSGPDERDDVAGQAVDLFAELIHRAQQKYDLTSTGHPASTGH